MHKLSDLEFDISKELFSIAIANVADSFSKMSNDKVLVNNFDTKYIKSEEVNKVKDTLIGKKQYTLRTEIKGKMQGRTYLIFSEEDVQNVFKVFAPAPIHDIDPSGKLTDIQQDILLELDNILSAALVTKLSDFLDVFIYGDIPRFNLEDTDNLTKLFSDDIKSYNTILQSEAILNAENQKMSPLFLCFFEDEFLLTAKERIVNRKDKVLQKIKVSQLKRD